jgi:TolB-like protein/Tfp pilus assembly protein PilF
MGNSDQPRVVRFGAFTFDPLAGELRKQGRKLKLQGQPIEILAMLLGRPGEIITREELQKRLWPENTFVDFEHSLNAAVKRLRDTLDDSAEAPRYVETLARRGYRFIPPVEDTGLFHRFDARGETIDSMAVLPFVNASSNPDTEYLSDGIAESLINSLSQLPRLKVMSRDSAFRYKGKETDAETVGRQLRVRTVFKGRITQRDSSVAIGVELIDARDNSQIWGQRYDRKLADILVLQDEIAKEITTALQLRLTGAEEKRLGKRHTEDAEAYQLYLKGRYYWNKRTKEAARKGVNYFQQAIDRDPTYARAYAGLADSYYVLGYYNALPPKDAFPKAKAAATKALEAEKEFNRAVELNPRYASAYEWHANLFTVIGRREEGLAQMKRAQEMDPLSLIINADLGRTFYFARDYDQSLKQLRKTIEMDPNFGIAHVFLGQVYVQKQMFEEAISEFQLGITLSSGSTYARARSGHTYAVAGQRGEAQRELNRLKDLSEQEYVSPHDIAVIHVGLGEKEQAFAWLERAYENRSSWLVYLKVEPALDPLRSDPRFADLLRRMNLQ